LGAGSARLSTWPISTRPVAATLNGAADASFFGDE
jgi:hypothetical protein